jgi:hypothetical protein
MQFGLDDEFRASLGLLSQAQILAALDPDQYMQYVDLDSSAAVDVELKTPNCEAKITGLPTDADIAASATQPESMLPGCDVDPEVVVVDETALLRRMPPLSLRARARVLLFGGFSSAVVSTGDRSCFFNLAYQAELLDKRRRASWFTPALSASSTPSSVESLTAAASSAGLGLLLAALRTDGHSRVGPRTPRFAMPGAVSTRAAQPAWAQHVPPDTEKNRHDAQQRRAWSRVPTAIIPDLRTKNEIPTAPCFFDTPWFYGGCHTHFFFYI